MAQGGGLKDDGKPSSDMKSLSFVFNTENIKRMVPSVCGDHTIGKLDDTQKALYMPVVEETPEETTTTPVEETTTAPADETTANVPSDETTTAPADETTAPADETTTAIPENTTKAPENTTKTPEEPAKKSCGGFALAAQLVTILGAAVTVVIVKKK